ncbi:hypothetical protein F4604DRAFT_1920191 [Suillus subluteus]|nr:hypothetical protein F4604DRAFT_1920191 [Suillus subluteus]
MASAVVEMELTGWSGHCGELMREYFQTPSFQCPKVFGMTASPIWNPKDDQGSLMTLERNLDAIVIAVREHVSELLHNSPHPLKIIKEYYPLPTNYIYLHPNLWDCVSLFSSPDVAIPREKLQMKYHQTSVYSTYNKTL